ncbi:MAG TPA: MFS transporter [Pyrinomonadaceae bacterium]|nr:MFS transporter [Pyrinomonadaceae bacterium]
MFKGKLPAGLRTLKHRNFQLYFFGQVISLTGSWIQLVAQSWLVYRMTDSAVMLGLVTFAGQTPGFFLAPLGGALADRLNRRRVLLVTQTCSMLLAFGLGLLTLSGLISTWHVFVFAALLGVVNAFDIPARQAMIVEMVGEKDLMNAVALNSSAVNIARLAGPALAGVMVAALGAGWCFVANGLSFGAVITSLLLMTAGTAARPAEPRPVIEHILEGFRFVFRASPVRAVIVLFGLVTLLGMPYAVLMPIFADRVLGGGPAGQGILMTAAGVGALAGTLCLVARSEARRLANWTAASAAAFGLGLILFALSETFWLSAALLVPVGFSMMLMLATSNTILQALTPNSLRGRVMAAYTMAFLLASPVGALSAGWVSGQIGASATVALGGVGCVAAAALFGLRLPALRDSARRLTTLGVLAEPGSGASAPA